MLRTHSPPSAWEQVRILAMAQTLFLERGIQATSLADIAGVLRLPTTTVEQYYPAGKAELLEVSLTAYVEAANRTTLAQAEACSNAVEELLHVRRTLLEMLGNTRNLFMQELAAYYPAQWQRINTLLMLLLFDYIRANLQRGIAQGLYRADLAVEAEARRWLQLTDGLWYQTNTSLELVAALRVQFNDLFARITTLAGAFAVRRLQEAPPYY